MATKKKKIELLPLNLGSTIQVGLDPGEETGLGIADLSLHDKLIEIHTLTFWGALDLIMGRFTPADIRCINIELSRKTASFGNTLLGDKKEQSQFDNPEVQSIARIAHKRGINVGGVAKQGELMLIRLTEKGYACREVAPIGDAKGVGKNRDQQMNFFRCATGWMKKSNTHTRDAGLMAVMQ